MAVSPENTVIRDSIRLAALMIQAEGLQWIPALLRTMAIRSITPWFYHSIQLLSAGILEVIGERLGDGPQGGDSD